MRCDISHIQPIMYSKAFAYFQSFVKDFDLEIKLVKGRKTKLGDFCAKINAPSIITINNNLNKDTFAVIFSHELAHYIVYKKFERKAKPHGNEWKLNYITILSDLLNIKAFEDEKFNMLVQNIIYNPKATVSKNDLLFEHLVDNQANSNNLKLKDIQKGDKFTIVGKTRIFEKLEKRRIRYICRCIDNNYLYLIHECTDIVKIKA